MYRSLCTRNRFRVSFVLILKHLTKLKCLLAERAPVAGGPAHPPQPTLAPTHPAAAWPSAPTVLLRRTRLAAHAVPESYVFLNASLL